MTKFFDHIGTEAMQGDAEGRRISEVSCYVIKAEKGDPDLDTITPVAVRSVGGEIGGISLVHQSKIWLPSTVGIDITSVPRAGSFCTCVIQSGTDSLFEIEDASADKRFKSNPLVKSINPFLHYAGVSIFGMHGYMLGSLWMMRRAPGRLSQEQADLFRKMAKVVTDTLEFRYSNKVTGMSNRVAFIHHFQAALVKRKSPDFLVGHFDLIAFRQVNDAVGRLMGNEVLRIFGKRLSDWVGVNNQICHLDGVKFAFCLQLSGDFFEEKIGSLKLLISQSLFIDGIKPITLHARIGLARSCVGDYSNATDLLDNAETAASSITVTPQQSTIMEYCEDMLARSRSIVVLQAVLDGEEGQLLWLTTNLRSILSKGILIGMEALGRWQHPERGLVQPSYFISLAESAGKIYQLDNLMLSNVCRDLRQWLDQGLEPVPVSFNYFRVSLLHRNVLGDFFKVLDKYSIPGCLLELEVTETQLLENADLISHRVSQFRQYGVRIAIDDFGTGYSNLDAINNFPFDRLKVDRRFVGGVSGSERISALFKFIHGVADFLWVDLLCEGVERIDDLLWLKKGELAAFRVGILVPHSQMKR